MADAVALSRLFQLASPMLPVGAYAYSQGLETAVEEGVVTDAASAAIWIDDVLSIYLARFELPLLARLHAAWLSGGGEVAALNRRFCAARDNAEALAETLQMGYSMRALLRDIEQSPDPRLDIARALDPIAFPTMYALAAVLWGIDAREALHAYAWSWAENQVAVAMKAVPIGQVAGQRLLMRLGAAIPTEAERALDLAESDLSNCAPGLYLAGCRHETQYSRLFRS